MSVPIWQRCLGILIYLLTWSDSIPFGRNLFLDFPFLQVIAAPAIPIILLERSITFGSLLLFLILFLAIIRNPKVSYFLRFNTFQALLLDIGIILIAYAFRIILDPLGSSLIVKSLSSTVLIGSLTILIFVIFECLQGKEPDLPGSSDAVRIQL